MNRIFLVITVFSLIFISCENKSKKEASEFFKRGNYHFSKAEYERAEELFSESIEKYPDWPDAFLNRGLTRIKLEKPHEALDDIQKAVSLEPEFMQARISLADILLQTGDLQAAEEQLSLLQKTYTDSLAFINLKANYLIQKENPTEAIPWLQKSISKKATAESYTNLGYASYLLKNWQEAESSFLKALELDENFGFALNNYSALLATKGEFKEALQFSEKNVKKHPTNSIFKITHTLNLIENNRLKEAEELISQIEKLEPTNKYNLRNKYVMKLKGELNEDEAQKLIALEKESPEIDLIQYYTGLAYQKIGNTKMACVLFEKGSDLKNPLCIAQFGKNCQ